MTKSSSKSSRTSKSRVGKTKADQVIALLEQRALLLSSDLGQSTCGAWQILLDSLFLAPQREQDLQMQSAHMHHSVDQKSRVQRFRRSNLRILEQFVSLRAARDATSLASPAIAEQLGRIRDTVV